MTKTKYPTAGTVPKSKSKIDISNTQTHEISLSWIYTDASIKSRTLS